MVGVLDALARAPLAQAAEAAGYESVWTGEHIVLPDPQVPPSPAAPETVFVDTAVALAYIAAATDTIKLGSGMLLLAHWIACLNFMVCRLAKTKPADGGPDAEFEFPSNSWVVNANLEHAPVGEQYAWALFKALCAMLMLGFEGPPFTNVTCGARDLWCPTEHWTVLVCLWIGAIFYALLVSSMTSIIASMNIARRQYEEKLAQVHEHMSFKKLPSALRDRVRQYFELKYSDGMVFEEETILADLTPNLQREIRRCLSSARLLKVPFIKSSPKLLMERVATCVEPLIVFADEVVVHEHHQVAVKLGGAKRHGAVAHHRRAERRGVNVPHDRDCLREELGHC